MCGWGTGQPVLVMCANNYLGLAQHPALARGRGGGARALGLWPLVGAFHLRHPDAAQAIWSSGSAASSAPRTRFSTARASTPTRACSRRCSRREDAVISDELNHASIIDGVRLCKAQRLRFKHSDMADLESKLAESADARFRLIATDGVFSMDGDFADLPAICDLADRYDALVMVDDSHAVGFVGPGGRGTPEHHGVVDRVDILTGTLGKALGGASGGYTSGRQEIIDTLAAALATLSLLQYARPADRGRLHPGHRARARARPSCARSCTTNTRFFRAAMTDRGFDIRPGTHPIVPIMLGDASLATRFADLLLTKGVYVVGFSYPVVPRGQARIRVQVSAAHSLEDLAFAVETFAQTRKELQGT